MAKKKTSIKDVAEALGISITTVSFILNGKAREKRISEEMTKKVTDYIQKIGYKPSHLAQSLRSGKSKIIVFMVEDISNQFFASIARLIEEKAYKNGYKIIYCSTDNDVHKAKELISTFRVRNVDGFIITPTPKLESTIKSLMEEELAVVLFDRWIPDLETPYVIVENKKSSREATNHLISEACKNIGFVTIDSLQTQMVDRLVGFKKAIAQKGVSSAILKVNPSPVEKPAISVQIRDFINANPLLDGFFFSTNYLAFEGLLALSDAGRKIPQDVKVVSFDDHYLFNLYQPKITAIEQPLESIAEKLMESMLRQLDEGSSNKSDQGVVLPNKLNVRASSLNGG